MIKKEAVLILFSLLFLIGAGCEQNEKLEREVQNQAQEVEAETAGDICNEFSESEKESCMDTFYLTRAKENNDMSLCDNIVNLITKESCYIND